MHTFVVVYCLKNDALQSLIHICFLQMIILINGDIKDYKSQSVSQSDVSFHPLLHELDESIYE